MSKSVGNVLDPFVLLERYGADYLRYYVASEMPFGADGNFSDESFKQKINTDLANDVGNLAQRVLTLVQRHTDGRIPVPSEFTDSDNMLIDNYRTAPSIALEHLQTQNLKPLCEVSIHLAKLGNKYIDTQAPWKLAKSDQERLGTVLYVLMDLLRHTGVLLRPVIPSSCDVLLDQLGIPSEQRTITSLKTELTPGAKIGTPTPIFRKID